MSKEKKTLKTFQQVMRKVLKKCFPSNKHNVFCRIYTTKCYKMFFRAVYKRTISSDLWGVQENYIRAVEAMQWLIETDEFDALLRVSFSTALNGPPPRPVLRNCSIFTAWKSWGFARQTIAANSCWIRRKIKKPEKILWNYTFSTTKSSQFSPTANPI